MMIAGKRFLKELLTLICLAFLSIDESSAQSFLKTIWEKDYDVNNASVINSVIKSEDGSFLLVGETGSVESGATKILVLKITPEGNLLWQKSLGTDGGYKFRSVCKSKNEGFYVAGIKQDAQSKKMICVTKADANGNVLWESTIGGGEGETVSDIIESSDYGVLVCGSKVIKGDHDTDGWLVKINKKGTIESQALLGHRYIDDEFSSIISNNSGGYVISGSTSVKLGDEKVPYFVSVDFRGDKKWEKSFPELIRTIPSSLYLNKDGSIACLAKIVSGSGQFEKISKLVINSSGELIKNVSINTPLNISKNSYIQVKDDQLIMLSAMQDKAEIPADKFIIRLDNSLKPVWKKTQDLENVSLGCLNAINDTDFISAGSVNYNSKMNCEAVVFQDLSDKEIGNYIDQKLMKSGMAPNENRNDFKNRIGRSKFESYIVQFTSDAEKDLSLIPDNFFRDLNAPSDSRPSIIVSSKKNEDEGGGIILKGNYYALLIAINDYKDPAINSLDKPISDAQKLFDVLVSDYMFEKANITFLKNPTREQIISSLDRLEKTLSKSDNLLIFYAGHGYWNDVTQKGYWLASDASKENTANWIGNSSISDYVRSIPAKHTLLIADACFSGSIFKTRAAFGNLDKTAKKLYELTSRKAMTSGTLTEVPDKSVFVEYLVKRLSDNTEAYLSSEQLFFSFKPAVLNNTDNIPQFGVVGNAGDEGGDFLFIKRTK
jgi:hypothetical protein